MIYNVLTAMHSKAGLKTVRPIKPRKKRNWSPARPAIRPRCPEFRPPLRSNPHRFLKKVGKEIVDFVEKNFDDVGCDFAKEALKIHYGVEEPRNIRGVSTKEEEKMLKEEGIDFLKIPMPAPPDTDA